MFWTDKRVMVTGGYGFLGSYVTDKLLERGCPRTHISRMHSGGYDLRDRDDVRDAFRDQEPDIVINVAATVGGIGANIGNPGKFLYDNLMMGLLMMEEARVHGVQKFVQIGTVCSYPSVSPAPLVETDIWNGYPEPTNAPYGIAKRTLLELSASYKKQYGLNSVNLIPVNLYGPRDTFDPKRSHVIPALIRKCLEAKESGQPLVVWGTGKASREFLHADDCAEAILLATEFYNSTDPVNVGTGEEILVRHLVGVIADMVGFTGEVVWDSTKPDGQLRRVLDVSKAEKEFGFRAKKDFKTGLKETIEWYERTRP
jgi:GDP-L-fucose synthase